MDGTLRSILADDLYARLGTATAPIVLDVRRSDAFNADDRMIVSAAHCDVTREQQWLDGLAAAKAVVVYCADGGAISQAAAAVLRTAAAAWLITLRRRRNKRQPLWPNRASHSRVTSPNGQRRSRVA